MKRFSPILLSFTVMLLSSGLSSYAINKPTPAIPPPTPSIEEPVDIEGLALSTIRSANMALKNAALILTFLGLLLGIATFLGAKEYISTRKIRVVIEKEFETRKASTLKLLERCEEITTQLETFAEAKYNIISGKVYYSQKHYEAADREFNEVPLEHYTYEVELYRGLIRLKYGDYNDALNTFNKALKYPDCDKATVYLNMGVCYSRKENYRAAIGKFDKAIEEKGNCMDALAGKASALRHLGDLKGAISVLIDATKLDETYARAPYNLACYYALLNKPRKAIEALKESFDRERTFKNLRIRIDMAREDPDFEIIRKNETFKKFIRDWEKKAPSLGK